MQMSSAKYKTRIVVPLAIPTVQENVELIVSMDGLILSCFQEVFLRALEQIGSLMSSFVSCFFDNGKHIFEFSELVEHCNAAWRNRENFSEFSNDFLLNQSLLN